MNCQKKKSVTSMQKDEGNIELFERYHNGALTESELENFENRIAKDGQFQIEFESYKAILKGISNHFRAEFKMELKKMDDGLDLKTKKSPLLKKIVIWSVSSAAILIISLMVLQGDSLTSSQELAFVSWEKEPGLPVKMSSKADLDEAMNAYKLEDFLLADSLFSAFDSDTSNFYLANTQYELEKYPEALISLSLIKEGSVYYHKAQYKEVLIFLIQDKVGGAKELLESIVNKGDSPYSQEALNLLDKL